MHCPSDETLAAHLVGAPLDGGSEPVRAHLDTCDVCRELMIAMARQAPEDLDLAATNPVLPVWPEATTPTVAAADYEFLPTIDPSHYVLGNSLARGGMGRIRVARDRRLGRNVAIKELLVASEVMRQRFEREVRITARLQHPAIVSVIEAGTWPSGEPFFAMKLVSGTSLDRVIASRPTVAERLGLLPSVIAASDALGYAHAEHVIHRDLKPQNILVGDFGETVVIDWGLAKDLDEAAGMTSGEQRLREAAETVDGTVIGTPRYMPPEQARGEPVDERADVFALGVILFEVLSGDRPFPRMSTKQILAHLAANGSVALDRCPAGTPRDLIAIVRKATAPDPEDRYPTAKELAEDLKRFQTGKLVDAYAYTRWQLVGRWIARNRRTVAVGAVLLLALAAISAASVHQIVVERDVARTQRAAAEQLVSFMVFELHDRLDTVGRLDLMTGLGTSIRNYYSAVPSTHAQPTELERRARAYFLLGDIEARKGNSDDAKRLFDEGIALGTSLLASLPDLGNRIIGTGFWHQCELAYEIKGTTSARPLCNRALLHLSTAGPAPSYGDERALPMTYVRLARAANDDGMKDEALRLFGKARSLLDALAPRFPADAGAQLDLSDLYARNGFAQLSTGDADGAYDLLVRGVSIARQVADADRKNARAAAALARVLADLAAAQSTRNEHRAALASLHESSELLRPLVEREPEDLALQELHAGVLIRLAQVETALQDPIAAVAAQDAARPILERLVKADPKAAKWKSVLAFAMDSKGLALADAKQLDAARVEYVAADKLLHELIAATPKDARNRELLVINTLRLAEVDLKTTPAHALPYLDAAIPIASALVVETRGSRAREFLAGCYQLRGEAKLHLDDRGDARIDLDAAIAGYEALARDVPAQATHYRDLARDATKLRDRAK